MPRANKMRGLSELAMPMGTQPGPVGVGQMPMLESPEGPAPRETQEPEGESAAQNAILQAIAGPQAEEQITPEEEEEIKRQLAMAARQQLMGGGGLG